MKRAADFFASGNKSSTPPYKTQRAAKGLLRCPLAAIFWH
jgi:hypothetical protein